MKRLRIPRLIFAALAGLVLACCQTTQAGYQSAHYTVAGTDRKFEVRDYPALMVMPLPVYGYCDPPWTPAFPRRNEVMLLTEAEK